jgi:hypothetical protein
VFIRRATISLLALGLVATHAAADGGDSLTLKNGLTLRGSVIAEDGGTITFRIERNGIDTTHTIPRAKVERIQYASDSPARTRSPELLLANARSDEELEALGHRFYDEGDYEHAATAVERAPVTSTSLLSTPAWGPSVADRAWRTFWLRHTLQHRLAAEATRTIDQRIELATWARKNGLVTDAERLLQDVLRERSVPTGVRALAAAWGLAPAEPFRFDLLYALQHPLFLDAVADEGTSRTPDTGTAAVLIPFRYVPDDLTRIIRAAQIEVQPNPHPTTTVFGLALLLGPTTPAETPATTLAAQLTLQPGSDPLLERFEITLDDANGARIIGHNPTGPRSPASGDNPRSLPRRLERPASGFAAFVVQAPQNANTLTCAFRVPGKPFEQTLTLRRTVAEALARGPAELAAPGAQDTRETLIDAAGQDDKAVALAAVAKLTNVRAAAAASDRKPTLQRIDTALLGALAHNDVRTRHAAWAALTATDVPLPDTTINAIAKDASSSQVQTILGFCERALERGRPQPPDTPDNNRNATTRPDDEASPDTDVPFYLRPFAPSQTHRNVFAILDALLRLDRPDDLGRAVDVLLADGTRPSLLCLVRAPAPVHRMLAERLENIPDSPLLSALIRVVLRDPSPPVAALAIRAADRITLTVTQPDDPLLVAVESARDVDLRRMILNQLARADVDAVLETPRMRSILKACSRPDVDIALRRAAVDFAIARRQGIHIHDVPRDNPAVPQPIEDSVLLDFLAAAADDPDPALRQKAATALLESGHHRRLREIIRNLDEPDARDLLDSLLSDPKRARTPDAWMLLAGALDPDDGTAAPYILDAITRASHANRRVDAWRFNLHLFHYITGDALIRVMQTAGDPAAARAADLLNRLALLNTNEFQELRLAPRGDPQRTLLHEFERRRTTAPTGAFATMLYLDVAAPPGDPAVASAPPHPRTPDKPLRMCWSIPLPGPRIDVTTSSDHITVFRASPDQLLAEGRIRAVGDLARGPIRGTIDLNVAPLITEALRSNEAQQAALRDRVNLTRLGDQVPCSIQHIELGYWAGELVLQDPRALAAAAPPPDDGADDPTPVDLVSARIVLVPTMIR